MPDPLFAGDAGPQDVDVTGGVSDWEDEPIGPDDLTIRTPQGIIAEPESWLALAYSTLRTPGGFLIVSSGPPDLYAQAMNHEGRLLLEYRDGAPDKHFQVTDVGLDDVARALSEWFRGERAFLTAHTWKRLSQ